MRYSAFDPQKGIIGISIGPEKVFLTCLKLTDGKWEIEKSVSADIAPDVVKNGLIADVQGLAQALKKAVKDNDIKARQVFASVSDSGVIMREVEMPEMPRAQTKEALKAEVDKYMLGGEETIIDYYSLEKEKVFLIAIKKDKAIALLAAMEKAGLNLIGIDIFPLAVLRALSRENMDLSPGKATILILVSEEKVDISVIKGGTIVYSRGIDTSEITELAKEIRATKAYWEEQYPDLPVEKIVVLTDAEKAEDLHKKLPKDLGVIEQGMPLDIEPSGFNLSRSASMGLAMRGPEEKRPFDINLLPAEKFLRMELEEKLLFSVVAVSIILVTLFVASFMLILASNSYAKKIKPIKQKIALSPDLLAKVEKINEQRLYILDSLNKKKEFIDQVKITPWPQILTDIKNYIPDEVWLTEISSKGKNVELRGKAYSQDAVYKYVHLLAFSDYFYESKLAFIRGKEKEGRSIFEFDIICSLTEESVSKR